jgi:ferredoxin
MKVWIDQDSCVGNGICEELCPEVFVVVEGGLGYVRDRGRLLPEGRAGLGTVPPELEMAVLDAAEQCPAECIFLEED